MSRAESQLRRKRRKERKRQRSRSTFPFYRDLPPNIPIENLRSHSYNITWDSIDNAEAKSESDEEFMQAMGDARDEIFDDLNDNPAKVIPALENWLIRFPDSKLLMNWLAAAYTSVGQTEKSDKLTRRNYEFNPNYLFARLSYALLLLNKGQTDEAADVMENKWDLQLLYPDRDLFHISEFLTFAALAVTYFVEIDQLHQAEMYLNMMEKVEPDHRATQTARAIFEKSAISALAEKFRKLLLRDW